MRRLWPTILMLASTAVSAAELEEIVVTGSRVDVDYYEMPAVTVTRTADFLVQNIRLVNDSRAPDRRREEILTTIRNLLERADSMPGMALSYGEGFLEPINLDDNSLELIEDRQRIDTSFVDIYAKVELNQGLSVKSRIADLREFIEGSRKDGRTEVLPLGDIGLSVIGPEQYRYEIIRRIGAERSRISEALQGDCDFTLKGLEGRVQWERTSVSELTLFIHYAIEVSNCAR